MRSSLVALTLAVTISAIASGQEALTPARAQAPLEIVLDLKNRLALVPEGTVIPAGLKVSARWSTVRVSAAREKALLWSERALLWSERLQPSERRESRSERGEATAFVFAYAPESVFVPYRAANKQRFPGGIKPLDSCSGPSYVYASHPSCGGCQVTLVHSECTSSGFPDYTETYFGDSYPAMQAEFEYATIYSSDNYFSCYQQDFWSSASVGCYDDDTRHNIGSPSTTVYIEGFAEFLSGGNLYDVTAYVEWTLYSVHRNP